MGNHPSQEIPPTPAPTPPPPSHSPFLDFNQYGWVYMGGAMLIVVTLVCCIKCICCKKSKEQKDLEKTLQVQNRNEYEMALMQREQYLGPGKEHLMPSSAHVVHGQRRAVSTNRALSLRSNSNSNLAGRRTGTSMVYNPEYAGVQISPQYADSVYRVSVSPNSTYRTPLRDSRRNSWRSQKSLRRHLNASEDSLLPHDLDIKKEVTFQSQKSIEQLVAEKFDEEVERRVQIELSKIIQDSTRNGKHLQISIEEPPERVIELGSKELRYD